MNLIAKSFIKHNGETFEPGATFEVEDKAQAQTLIDAGAAEAAEKPVNKQVAVKKEPAKTEAPKKAISDMNRDELEAFAESIGMQGPFESFDSKAKLIEAINAKQNDTTLEVQDGMSEAQASTPGQEANG